MNLVIVSDAYPPEIRSSSHLMVELAEGLRDQGHTVHVLTCQPAYNLDEAAESKTFPASAIEDGVHVVRVRTLPHHNVGFMVRGIAQLLLPIQFLLAFVRHVRGPIDGVIVYSPPLTLSLVGGMLKVFWRARYILNVQDVFPQNAIDLGVLRQPGLIAFFRWLERSAYARADIVTAHSEGNRQQLMAANPGSASKFRVLHNWVEATAFDGGVQGGRFREEWGLQGRYIALFAGVMGPSQDLGRILDAAARVRDLDDFVVLLVGDGMERGRMEDRARREGLDNVQFRPFVSREDYPTLVADIDVGLVCLSNQNHTPVVPGKILGYMAGGKPVAAFLNAESDGHAIIQEARCGASCVSDDPAAVEAILRDLYARRGEAAAMGAAGARYVRDHFSKDQVLRQIVAWLGRGG
jgi:colanic acid biosynthesis glycosyl transferase WcaI